MVWGGVGAHRRSGARLRPGAVWRHGQGPSPGDRRSRCSRPGLIAEGLVFGAPRLLHVDQLQYAPGRTWSLAAEILIGLALPWLLLRPGERRAGYVSLVVLGIVAAVAIQPLVALLRIFADSF